LRLVLHIQSVHSVDSCLRVGRMQIVSKAKHRSSGCSNQVSGVVYTFVAGDAGDSRDPIFVHR
jgi:hypothetical protein